MTNIYQISRNKLLEKTIDFLWRQWTSLGVPGNRAYTGDAIIDPEALLLITTELGRHDSRLMDLSIDWLNMEGKRINLQRLKGLHSSIHFSDSRVLSAIAEILSEQSIMRKWKSLSEGIILDPEERLFISTSDASSLLSLYDPDVRFKKYRLLRPQWEPRHACLSPSASRPENLLLTLRSFFGVNARAEIMAWLLTHDSGYPASIARSTGYFSKSIQFTLNEMADSSLIISEKRKREKHFRLRKQDWQDFFGFPDSTFPLRWIAWPWTFYYISRTLQLLEQSASENPSTLLRAIQQRGFLNEAAPWLHESGLRPEMSAEREMKGQQLTEAILQDVKTLGELLDNDFRSPS